MTFQFIFDFETEKMKFLIVACLLAAVAAQEEWKLTKAIKNDCVDAYFERKNLTSKCEVALKNIEAKVTGYLEDEITFDWTLKCIKENIKKYDVVNFFMHAERDTTPTCIGTCKWQETVVRDAIQSLCIRLYKFDDNFENFLEAAKLNQEDRKYQCLYKWAIKDKLIVRSDFDFDTSDFDSFNCTDYFTQFDKEIKKFARRPQKTQRFHECFEDKNNAYFVVRDLEVFKSIGRFTISDVQKKKLKALYWLWFTSEDRFFMECVRDLYKTPDEYRKLQKRL